MKAIVADIYTFYVNNSKDVSFPKRFRGYKILWDPREALFAIWEGDVTEIALPKLGTPGYNFEEFIENMIKIGQIKDKPKIRYYEVEVASKS